jgi:hypothetical protein
MPQVGQGLGVLEPKCPRIPTLVIGPADGPKALSNHNMIVDRH